MQGLKNKNVIVCAGSTGIGKGVISTLARYGVNITTFFFYLIPAVFANLCHDMINNMRI